MRAFYNEIDRYCCDWLQNLMDAGLITPGKIDDRSIADLSPDDCRGYERCHFFAGIAGWELALSLSGYTGPVWTGSCPCQPFSAAGKGKASSDERHLWPVWFELIRAVRPPVIFGEQVEAAIGWGWLDLVYSDLEEAGYTVGAAVLPACSVGAPHIRQRLWFVAHTGHESKRSEQEKQLQECHSGFGQPSASSLVADANPARCREGRAREAGNGRDAPRLEPTGLRADGSMGDTASLRLSRSGIDASGERSQRNRGISTSGSSPWSDLLWLPCTDGKQRPTEPGIQPLAHGVPARVAKLRAAGNAIVPQAAAEFIKASMT